MANILFYNVKSEEHIRELVKKLYVKITEVLIAEITREDCVNYIKELVINRTYDGYVREIKTIYEQLQNILKIEPAPDKWDKLFNVDFFITLMVNLLAYKSNLLHKSTASPKFIKSAKFNQITHSVYSKIRRESFLFIFL